MDDLISRQAAIDRINKQREHLQPDIYPPDKIGDAAYRICAEFIERLPSAQPEQPEITAEQVKEYCDLRNLVVLTKEEYQWLKSLKSKAEEYRWNGGGNY